MVPGTQNLLGQMGDNDEPIRFIVTGGRGFTDQKLIEKALDWYAIDQRVKRAISEMRVGDCPTGVDRIATDYAEKVGWIVRRFKANWDSYGKSAGPIRNSDMVNWYPVAEFCLAFPGGDGTADCVKKCEQAKIRVIRIGEDWLDNYETLL